MIAAPPVGGGHDDVVGRAGEVVQVDAIARVDEDAAAWTVKSKVHPLHIGGMHNAEVIDCACLHRSNLQDH